MGLIIKEYNREKAVAYAQEWAYKRNPKYLDFENLGGDCTNFASQCLFAGANAMNYTKTMGWYYNSAFDRAPAWSGTEEFYRFIINNKGVGPFAKEVSIKEIEVGDFIQLRINQPRFHHTPITLNITDREYISPSNILVAAHTYDSLNRPLSSYDYKGIRYIHILGVRVWG